MKPSRPVVSLPVVLGAVAALGLALALGAVVRPAGAAPAGLFAKDTPTPTPTPRVAYVYLSRGQADFDVDPEEAHVHVDGKYIGRADDWDDSGGGRLWTFSGRGDHYVKLSLKGYRTVWVKVTVDPAAPEKVAKVKFDLPKR